MEMMSYSQDLLSITIIAILMAISPGADFVMVTRNSLSYGKSSGIFSALGISVALWIHVFYSIAGLALIISQSIILFSIIKYLGASYLLYIGWKSLRSKSHLNITADTRVVKGISRLQSFKIGFITNALNPKATLFFLSIFTQFVNQQTPLWLQIMFGAIISVAHFIWFTFVASFFSHPVLLQKFTQYKRGIEKTIGCVLIGLGLKVATMSQK